MESSLVYCVSFRQPELHKESLSQKQKQTNKKNKMNCQHTCHFLSDRLLYFKLFCWGLERWLSGCSCKGEGPGFSSQDPQCSAPRTHQADRNSVMCRCPLLASAGVACMWSADLQALAHMDQGFQYRGIIQGYHKTDGAAGSITIRSAGG